MRRPLTSTLFPYTTLFRSRSALTEYRAQKRGGRGKTGATTKEDDFVSDLFVASTHAFLMPITSRGKLRSEEHTSELQSLRHLVCRLLLEKKKKNNNNKRTQ